MMTAFLVSLVVAVIVYAIVYACRRPPSLTSTLITFIMLLAVVGIMSWIAFLVYMYGSLWVVGLLTLMTLYFVEMLVYTTHELYFELRYG